MAKSAQQKYLGAVVETVKCACGCGRDVNRKRGAYFPSQIEKAGGLPRYVCGHNPNAKARAAAVEKIRGTTGPGTNHWKGGRTVQPNGYVWIRIDGQYIAEHRLVMEKTLGRQLSCDEIIHHKDGNKSNNDFANLVVTNRSEHAIEHRKTRAIRVQFVGCAL
jgi:hypothetical protein